MHLYQGRDYVLPDDVQYLVPFVFAHRLILKPEANYEEVNSEHDDSRNYRDDSSACETSRDL